MKASGIKSGRKVEEDDCAWVKIRWGSQRLISERNTWRVKSRKGRGRWGDTGPEDTKTLLEHELIANRLQQPNFPSATDEIISSLLIAKAPHVCCVHVHVHK